MKFNKAIRAINNQLTEEWDRWCPLAAGNCGMFTVSLSRFLTKRNVPHRILFLTVWDGEEEMTTLTPQKIIDENMPGNHYVVEVGGKIVDFQGINSPDIIDEYSNHWNLEKLTLYVLDGNLYDIERAAQHNTCHDVFSRDFDEVIEKHFV